MEYNIDSRLEPGTIVGDTGRTVLVADLIRERVPTDTYSWWVAICHAEGELHPFVVWDVFARPEGWYASSGSYFKTFDEAEVNYVSRGGYPEGVF